MDGFSRANAWLRVVAGHVSPKNPVRVAAARAWQGILQRRPFVSTTINGKQIKLHPRYRSYQAEYETVAIQRCIALCGPESVVWDVGANIGLYSIQLALAKRAKRILALELHPLTAKVLSSHVTLNGLGDTVSALQLAVTDGSSDSIEIKVDEAERGNVSARISWLSKAAGNKQRVRAASLDQLVVERGEVPTFLKIDIEGAEYNALTGARRLLSGEFGSRPLALLAAHPMFIAEYDGRSMSDVTALVRELGYVSLDMNGVPENPERFDEYWLVPAERETEIAERLGALPKRPAA